MQDILQHLSSSYRVRHRVQASNVVWPEVCCVHACGRGCWVGGVVTLDGSPSLPMRRWMKEAGSWLVVWLVRLLWLLEIAGSLQCSGQSMRAGL